MRNINDITLHTVWMMQSLKKAIAPYQELSVEISKAINHVYASIPKRDAQSIDGIDDMLLCASVGISCIRTLGDPKGDGHDFTIAIAGSQELVARMLTIAMLRQPSFKECVEDALRRYHIEDGNRIIDNIKDL